MNRIEFALFEFVSYSVLGWLLEVIYRSLSNRKLQNPGFLTGPYLPIYGTGAVIISSIAYATAHISIVYKFMLYFTILSFLEYIAGVFLYKVFGKRFWDYTDELFNLNGHVCLSFSIIWAILGLIFEYTLLPLFLKYVGILHPYILYTVALSGITVMSFDFMLTYNLFPKFFTIPLLPMNIPHYKISFIKLQNNALLSLRYFVDSAFATTKKFQNTGRLHLIRFMTLIKKRYISKYLRYKIKNQIK